MDQAVPRVSHSVLVTHPSASGYPPPSSPPPPTPGCGRLVVDLSIPREVVKQPAKQQEHTQGRRSPGEGGGGGGGVDRATVGIKRPLCTSSSASRVRSGGGEDGPTTGQSTG